MKRRLLDSLIAVALSIAAAAFLGGLACNLKRLPTQVADKNSNLEPVGSISVVGPISPYSPTGPTIKVAMKNIDNIPITSLTAQLSTDSILTNSYTIVFSLSNGHPLMPDSSIDSETTLIGGGFNNTVLYPLKISGKLENGQTFNFTQQVNISLPALMPVFHQTSATDTNANGLSLTVSLDSTAFHPGDAISIYIKEGNTLSRENDVAVASKWPTAGFSLNPCDPPSLFGILILRGDYDLIGPGSVSPIQLFGVYNCPEMPATIITSYGFHPSSDTALVQSSNPPDLQLSIMSTRVMATGEWIGGPTGTFSNFMAGVYTVVAGDEWGAQALLHFVVL